MKTIGIAAGICLAAGVVCVAGAGVHQERDASAARKVDELFGEWNKPDSPGCGVGVSRNGVIVFERGYGMADVESRVPITPASIFHVASVSKQFTAMGIVLLAQRGRLALDDEARKHMPGWADDSNRLTIRHLLTHTGGVRDAFALQPLAPPTGEGDLNDQLVTLLARQRGLNFPPGSEFLYSNSGYVLLAGIVKRVSGQSLSQFADANIFRPLGMTHTHVHDDPSMVVPNRATGYHRDEKGTHPIPHADLGRLVGTTGVMTTVRDMLTWQQNFAKVRVGDPALVAAMQTPTLLTGGGTSAYGFGLQLGEDAGARTVGHGGGDPGYGAYVLRYSDHHVGVAVLCNMDNIGFVVGELARGVGRLFLPQTAKPSAASTPATRFKSVALSAKQLARLAGLYREPDTERYRTIFVRNGKLVAVAGADERGDSVELTATGTQRFVIPGTTVTFDFVPGARGQAQELRIAGDGPKPTVLRRVPSFTPSRADLKAFVGTYTSSDLDATYTVTAHESRLVIQMQGRSEVVVEPIAPDTFNGSLVNVVKFIRDARGAVVGFTLNSSGVRGLRFDRS